MREYIPRIADNTLTFLLSSCGAVLIKGPKWSGKSTMAERVAKSSVYMQNPAQREQNTSLARNDPEFFLDREPPMLIDEWQTIPFIWDSVRYEVDRRQDMGQFILTGSSTPLDADSDERGHSGAGRIVPMILRTMTLFESGDSNGKVSLRSLFDNEKVSSSSTISLERYAYLICRGGWPMAVIQKDERIALQQVRNYYSVLTEEDFQRMRKKTRSAVNAKALMRSYARNVATPAPMATIRKDMIEHGDPSLDIGTVASYIDDLSKLFTIEELESWNPNLRSKVAISTANVRHFSDPSIGCAALGISPADLINDLNTMGLFFESMAVRDLRVYAEALNGHIQHYRDSDGLEADAVIRLDDGRWGAVEVKLRDMERIEEGASNLKKLRDKVLIDRPPSFLAVITATDIAYRREDGVYVVPLGCLGP